MKNFILSVMASLLFLLSFGQTADKMLKHSGETLNVKIIKVGETTITYKYPGEDAEQNYRKICSVYHHLWHKRPQRNYLGKKSLSAVRRIGRK